MNKQLRLGYCELLVSILVNNSVDRSVGLGNFVCGGPTNIEPSRRVKSAADYATALEWKEGGPS